MEVEVEGMPEVVGVVSTLVDSEDNREGTGELGVKLPNVIDGVARSSTLTSPVITLLTACRVACGCFLSFFFERRLFFGIAGAAGVATGGAKRFFQLVCPPQTTPFFSSSPETVDVAVDADTDASCVCCVVGVVVVVVVVVSVGVDAACLGARAWKTS